MKFTLLTFVRSEEDDSLRLVSLNISLFVLLLWGFPKRFLLLGCALVSKRGFKPNTEAQVLAPRSAYHNVSDAKVSIWKVFEKNNKVLNIRVFLVESRYLLWSGCMRIYIFSFILYSFK